jgi:uncharacterized protein RhaS with RHS repeats
VNRNDTTISIYHYDTNGNKLSHVTQTDSTTGIYDAQDRMLAYGNATFGYTATGSLKWKAENRDTTRYYYDLMGNLISVGMSRWPWTSESRALIESGIPIPRFMVQTMP